MSNKILFLHPLVLWVARLDPLRGRRVSEAEARAPGAIEIEGVKAESEEEVELPFRLESASGSEDTVAALEEGIERFKALTEGVKEIKSTKKSTTITRIVERRG